MYEEAGADAPLQRVREHDDPEGGGAQRLAQAPPLDGATLRGRGRASRLRRAGDDARLAVGPQPDVLRTRAQDECGDGCVDEQREAGAQVRAWLGS